MVLPIPTSPPDDVTASQDQNLSLIHKPAKKNDSSSPQTLSLSFQNLQGDDQKHDLPRSRKSGFDIVRARIQTCQVAGHSGRDRRLSAT